MMTNTQQQHEAEKLVNEFIELHLQTDRVAVMDDLWFAFIGMSNDGRPVYSVDKIIQVFEERDGMTPEEAWEFFDYNTERAVNYIKEEERPILIYELDSFLKTALWDD